MCACVCDLPEMVNKVEYNFAVLFGSRNKGHANIKGFTVDPKWKFMTLPLVITHQHLWSTPPDACLYGRGGRVHDGRSLDNEEFNATVGL